MRTEKSTKNDASAETSREETKNAPQIQSQNPNQEEKNNSTHEMQKLVFFIENQQYYNRSIEVITLPLLFDY
jgi:hypothetical protein